MSDADVYADLGLRIPLQGVQLIEASAGTGKTFTVATVYARLVIEQRLPVSRLLAVTYTVAATRELRETLRERLVLALRMLELPAYGAGDCGFDSHAAQLTRVMLENAAEQEPWPVLLARLQRAAQEMDLAPIHTIHGFCQRALHDHALQAGQPLEARELVMNEAGLRHEVALAFWRQASRTPADAEALLQLWGSPAALASSLRELLALDALSPAAPGPVDDSAARALEAAREALAEAFHVHGASARESLRTACANKDVSATYTKDQAVDPVWQALARWARAPRGRDPDHKNVGWYARSHLLLKTNGQNSKRPGVTPVSPLFDAIEAWSAACSEAARALDVRKLGLVHRARDFARARLQQLKDQRGLLGFDDMIAQVHAALAGPQGEAFAQALQAQYAIALVDEFQDTDARQWDIFRRLFAQPAPRDGTTPRALFLIGDPKQAIYGFRGGDVATYLVAQAAARQRHPLARNFRSRPVLLRALEALFEAAGDDAFRQHGIGFERVQPGGACRDEFFTVLGEPQPGLLVQALDADPDDTGVNAIRDQAARACAARIHRLLQQGQQGQARLTDRHGVERAVQPGDVSVLVGRHADGERVQQTLSRLGIPSVAVGKQSLYATEEARQLCWLLEALMSPADDARLRAALATPLFGLTGGQIAAFDTDLAAHRGWQDRMQHWAQRARRHGPMAALGEICAEQAPRLLAWPDGERRLSNYLQLAEALQAADAVALGLAGLLAELERRIEDADPGNDDELLRLESDAARVRIMTVHASKGLTLDLVFVPFTADKVPDPHRRSPAMAIGRDPALARIGHLFPDAKDAVCAEEREALKAEHIRLLYVALTRARLATWVGWGAQLKTAEASALGLLLRGQGIEALHAGAPDAIALLPAVAADGLADLPRLQFTDASRHEPPLVPTRTLDRDWWVYSFSQLAREASGLETRGADDEFETPLVRSRFSGSRFGNALHEALENVDFAAWRDFSGDTPPTGQLAALEDALRHAGYSSDADQVDGVRVLCDLVGRTLNAPMPEGTRLAWLPAHERLSEMEFHLSLAPVRVDALLDLLHAHGLVTQRREFGLRRRLEGLLTGRIDLIYRHGECFHVLDYKSNQLPDYGPDAVARAIAEGEYDLQYLIYTVALHRWLRFRLGATYDPDVHLGGVRYLFCRGLERDDPQRPGLHGLRLPTELVLGVDALFGATTGVPA